MSLQGKRQEGTAKFSEQNYLHRSSIFFFTLLAPPFTSTGPSTLPSNLTFILLRLSPLLSPLTLPIPLSFYLFPHYPSYPLSFLSPSSASCFVLWSQIISKMWGGASRKQMVARTHIQQSYWGIKWESQSKMSLQLWETQREYYYQSACKPLKFILSYFILLFLLFFPPITHL